MKTAKKTRFVLLSVALLIAIATGSSLTSSSRTPVLAAAGPCAVPQPSYGTVQQTVNVPVAGTYKVWARMSAPERSKDTFMLDINGTQCLTMGGSTVPLYSSGAPTHFANNTTNWISRTPAGQTTNLTLNAGSYTFKSIGSAPGLVLDRIILTQDANCVPAGTGQNCAAPPDTTAPTVRITSPAANATMNATTNIVANATDNVGVTKVEFFRGSTLLGTDTTADASRNYSYSFSPSGIAPGNQTLSARAYDAAGNVTNSASVVVRIPDTTAPTVSVTAPTSGATLSGTATVSATAADNVGVTRVEFFVDGASKGSVTTPVGGRYSLSLATANITNGTRSLTARAFDAAGNSRTSTAVSFRVNNVATPPLDTTAPTVSVTAPTSTSTVRGSLSFSALAADSSGIREVRFYIDGTLRHTDTSAPYAFTIDSKTLSDGRHEFYAVAVDNSSNRNSRTSTKIAATVNNLDTMQGDLNGDGKVDILDFSILKSRFSRTGTAAGVADINGDGIVDIRDFSILRGNFGKR